MAPDKRSARISYWAEELARPGATMRVKKGDVFYVNVKDEQEFADRIPGVLSADGAALVVVGRDPGSNIILALRDGGLFLDGSRKITIHKTVLVPTPPSKARTRKAQPAVEGA